MLTREPVLTDQRHLGSVEMVNNTDATVAQRSLGCIKQTPVWSRTMARCWGRGTKPDAAIQVWPVSTHSAATLPGNCEADELA